jgi:hypothetical protein
MVQQERLGGLVIGVDKREDAIAPIDEPVAVTAVYSRRAQCRVEKLVELVAKLGLNEIRAASGTLDV